jgi:hypothetical protein
MSHVYDLSTPQHSEAIGDGLACEWYGDKQIIAYKLLLADEAVVQSWGAYVSETLANWPSNQPYLALHDLSAPGVGVFYMVYRNYDILNFAITPNNPTAHASLAQHQHLARVAIILSLSLSGRTTYQVASPPNADNNSIIYRGFFKRDQALAWLAEGL